MPNPSLERDPISKMTEQALPTILKKMAFYIPTALFTRSLITVNFGQLYLKGRDHICGFPLPLQNQ